MKIELLKITPMLLTFGIALMAISFSERNSAAGGDDELVYEKVYVDKVVVPEKISWGDSLNIEIWGNFPDPSYSFHHFEIKVDKSIIVVTPIAQRKKGVVVIQGLVPFKKIFTIKDLKPGSYQIQVVGRSRIISTSVVVAEE